MIINVRKLLPALLSILLLGSLPVPASAATFYAKKPRIVVLPADTIRDDIYIAGKEAAIDGVVTHDVCIACRSYKISGEIQGSLNSGSQNADIRGIIGNSARIFASQLTVDGQIKNDLLAFASEIQLNRTSIITNSAFLFGGRVSTSGEIGGKLTVRASDALISGKIGGDVDIKADRITIVAPTEIAGKLRYRSKEEIKIDSGVVITGGVEKVNLTPEELAAEKESGINWPFRIGLFLCSLVTGLILSVLINRHTRTAEGFVVSKPLICIGIGFIGACVAPIAIFILLITIVGIPIGIMLLFALTIFFYTAKIYIAIAAGRMVVKLLGRGKEIKIGWALLIGLVILTILFAIPYLGWIAYFGVVFWGIGATVLAIQQCRHFPAPPPATAPQASA